MRCFQLPCVASADQRTLLFGVYKSTSRAVLRPASVLLLSTNTMLANNIPVLTAALVALAGLTNAAPLSELLQKRASGQTIRPSTAPNLCLAGYGSPNLRLTECVTSYDAYYGPWTQWSVYPGESRPVSLGPVPPKAPGLCLDAGKDVSDGKVRAVNGVTCSADAQKYVPGCQFRFLS